MPSHTVSERRKRAGVRRILSAPPAKRSKAALLVRKKIRRRR